MNRKKITILLPLVLLAGLCCSCSYNELPPKTEDASTTYVTPKGVLPSAEERAEVEQAISEYNNAIKGIK